MIYIKEGISIVSAHSLFSLTVTYRVRYRHAAAEIIWRTHARDGGHAVAFVFSGRTLIRSRRSPGLRAAQLGHQASRIYADDRNTALI